MIARIIFCVSVSAAILAVILLATISPLPKSSHKSSSSPSNYNWIGLSLYIQPRPNPNPPIHQHQQPTHLTNSAYVFRYKLTVGPENSSRVVGSMHGFVLPVKGSVLSSFNMVHLALFYSSQLSGSLSIEARRERTGEELEIVGGTGSFAFSSGDALLLNAPSAEPSSADSVYLIKLTIGIPNRHQRIIPG